MCEAKKKTSTEPAKWKNYKKQHKTRDTKSAEGTSCSCCSVSRGRDQDRDRVQDRGQDRPTERRTHWGQPLREKKEERLFQAQDDTFNDLKSEFRLQEDGFSPTPPWIDCTGVVYVQWGQTRMSTSPLISKTGQDVCGCFSMVIKSTSQDHSDMLWG